MEKNIDNIIKFIETALNKKYCSVYSDSFNRSINVRRDVKENKNSYTRYIYFWIEGDNLNIGNDFKIPLNEIDKAKWIIIYNKVREHEARLTEELFDNFFKEDNNKPKNINDLDDDD